MKENSVFIINKNGSLYKNNVNIGLEKVTVTLQNKDGDTYTIDNVKWDDNSIYFYVPSVKKFYGKYIMVKVYYGSNDTYKTKTFEKVLYKPQFIINGEVDPDKNGNYPKYIKINSHQINIENGKFIYIAPDKGNYQISVNKNYQTKSITLTDENPTAYIYLNYIDLDYDNDGVENDKDAFPYDPAASVDSDGDGHPDKWNDGYTQADSTTGLTLDKYPNVMTEFGAVVAELGRQPKTARQFFIDYQDRIMFGKDSYNKEEFYTYFRILESDDEYFDYFRKRHAFWKMYGLNLPDEVLKKVYYENALRVFPSIPKGLF
jgi:hypothetical protein